MNISTFPQDTADVLQGDPRTANIDAEFKQLISRIAQAFGRMALVKGRRATHSYGTIARGTLTVPDALSIPAHALFRPGAQYPVLVRHANIKGFSDDAILDGRGATVRILDGNPAAPLSALVLDQPLVDILLSTGRSFILGDAVSFGEWVASSLEQRAAMLQRFPKITPIFAEIIRNPDTYTRLHYYSETTYQFVGSGGEQFFLRYRLVNRAEPEADTGWIDPAEVKLPLDYLPRMAGDFRSPTYLREDFRERVLNGGVQYTLQMQLRPLSECAADNEAAKDCTIPWDEKEVPFQDVAWITLSEILKDEQAEPLEFNPYHAPPELGLILAHGARETASVNHLRAIVYQISANMRKYQLPSAALVDWGTEAQPPLKAQYPYALEPGQGIASFDPTKPLPLRVQPKPRYLANFGLRLLPSQQLDPSLPELGIKGAMEVMGPNVTSHMPPNLTRNRPDKFSDDFFVERRLNGFNPGKLNLVQGQPWRYAVRYDCSKYAVEPSGILPSEISARFSFNGQNLVAHSIEFALDNQTETVRPGDRDWEWAKRLFRCAEFVFQEIQSHLGRTHMNMDQYAMAYYRNVVNHPIRLLLEPHLDGLLNINKLGAKLIKGTQGFIPEASSLSPDAVNDVLTEEVRTLSYRHWSPRTQALVDPVPNNHFDRAALAFWDILEDYVAQFFAEHQSGIADHWSEIEAMSDDLVTHSILKPCLGRLDVTSVDDLKRLCVYVIYTSSFFHSWVNNKQYEDGGDVGYATIGLWDTRHPAYNPMLVAQREAKQVTLLWTLSHVRTNPLMDVGPTALKDAVWQRRAQIEPGIALGDIMMSINI